MKKRIASAISMGMALIPLNIMGAANPASVFCEKRGGRSILVKSSKGDYGICLLKSGIAMEEWEYYESDSLMPDVRPVKERAEVYTRNLIIYYDSTVGKKELLRAADRYGAKVVHQYNNLNGIAVSIPEGKDMNKAISYFQKVKGVLSVNRDQILHLDTQPDIQLEQIK